MRVVVQRVRQASVEVDGEEIARIGPGLLILLAVAADDTPAHADWMAAKLASLRIFSGETGRMDLSLVDTAGEALVVSQFTLLGDVTKGTRPSFHRAGPPAVAVPIYEHFLKALSETLGRPVAAGRFGAEMKVELLNDGPVTLVIDR